MQLNLLPQKGGCSFISVPPGLILTMKLITFLLVATLSQVAANGFSQKISLNEKNVPLEVALAAIEKQTDYLFLYDKLDIPKGLKVSLSIRNASIDKTMNQLLRDVPLSYKIFNKSIVLRKEVRTKEESMAVPEAPEKIRHTITGKVSDDNGEGLPGVSILLKGTQSGTTTDSHGKYSLEVDDENTTLIFSFVGYTSQEIVAGSRTEVNVQLLVDVKALSEVVVIGYGTMKKTDLTGAVGLVSNKQTENQAVPNLAQALQGKLAGLNVRQTNGGPGAGAEIRIRGMGSFGASSSPLVVVDGIITSGGLTDLDPNSIESVTVLKDASSAAIYGSRGANGVVLVTTKRGSIGKEVISFQSMYSFDRPINKIGTVDAATYGAMVNDFYVNQGKEAPYADPASLGKGTNWQDEIFRTGGKQNYSLSFSGGTEKNLHAITMSYYKGDGIVLNSKYSRANFRVNNDIKPLKGLKLGSSFGFSYGALKQGDPQGAVNASLIYAPNVLPYNADGSYGIADRAGQPTTMTAPLVYAYERTNAENRLGLLGNLYAEYEIIPGLKFKTSIGAEYINMDIKNFVPSYNFGLGNSNGIATLNRQINSTKNYIIDNILTYGKTFGTNHHLDLMAGYTFQNERYEFVRAFRNTFSRNDENLQVLDAATSNDLARGNYTEWALQSYLGRLNYAFKEKYLLSSSIRIDQSSRFEKSNRTGIFPSVSAGWVLSNEDFIAGKLGPVSYVKLRAGYGVLGNQDVGIYPYQSLIDYSLFYNFGSSQNVVSGAGPTALANRNISWEKTTTTGAGLEFNLFQDRLGFIIDYYDRRTSDVLVRVPLPSISGLATYPYQNVGSVRNSGMEFTVDYRGTALDQDFTYNVGFNITINKNEVTKLDKGLDIIQAGGGQGGVETRTSQGHGINSFYGYVHNGIFQTNDEIASSPFQPNAQPGDIRFKDLNGDNIIDDKDRTYIGDFLAKQIIGFNGSARYKNFDLAVSVTGDFGRYQNIFASGFAAARAAESTNIMWADRWTGPGTSNYVPRIIGGDPNNNSRSSDFWVRSQDYIRIQNVQLGYDFSGDAIKKAGLGKIRLFIAGQNLFTFTKYPGFDPETTATAYPIARSLYMGLNLGF
ncbi:TonB-dependent receptor [Dyadobacter aurulentus]|uniref:TonB-dependent receptor n=1 Tax=Dyadobacter sp. UC 10 TaxID=2605428 RepID=UPI0011F2B00E|nr:TonB-dependent receptor [Dyadobacter sp. UC 10]KAA0993311.1 TonB-dependent receptor [Dyadobacter sp. UC 10]